MRMVFSVMLSMVRSFIGGTLIASCAILGGWYRLSRSARSCEAIKVKRMGNTASSSLSRGGRDVGGGVLGGVNWAYISLFGQKIWTQDLKKSFTNEYMDSGALD